MKRFLSFPAFYIVAIVLGGALLIYAFSTFRVDAEKEEETDNQLSILGANTLKFTPPSAKPLFTPRSSSEALIYGPQVPSPTPIPSLSPSPSATSTPTPSPTPTQTPEPQSSNNQNVKIDSIEPKPASFGTEITINGSNFGSSNGTITFYGSVTKIASTNTWSDNQIKAKVPDVAGNQEYQVEVQTSDGLKSNKYDFKVDKGQPTISNITPTNGSIGQEITINGKDFGSQGSVSFIRNGSPTNANSINSWADEEIRVVIPTGLTGGAYKIQVTTNDNRQSSTDIEDYLVNPS